MKAFVSRCFTSVRGAHRHTTVSVQGVRLVADMMDAVWEAGGLGAAEFQAKCTNTLFELWTWTLPRHRWVGRLCPVCLFGFVPVSLFG